MQIDIQGGTTFLSGSFDHHSYLIVNLPFGSSITRGQAVQGRRDAALAGVWGGSALGRVPGRALGGRVGDAASSLGLAHACGRDQAHFGIYLILGPLPRFLVPTDFRVYG